MDAGETLECALNSVVLNDQEKAVIENGEEQKEELSHEEKTNEVEEDKALAAQKDPAFYTDAQAYWDKIPATVNGMLGGYANINAPDIHGSDLFLRSIFKLKNPPKHGKAADCGAGIGRITKHLLQKHFGKVDLVEQCQTFIDRARENFKGSKKVDTFICQGLQHFTPDPDTYDVIWCQWVLGHLTDTDLEDFLRRMTTGLKPNGVIIIKENVTSTDEVELDELDSSVTRPEHLLLDIIERAELRVLKNTTQQNLPKGLYKVKIICLRSPKMC